MTPSNQLPASSMSSSPESLAPTSRAWLLLSIELALVIAGFLLLWPTTYSLLVEWEDTVKTTYTHGYLILLISVWLLFRNRSRLGLQPVAPSITACVALVCASLAWLLSLRSGIRTGEQVILPAMIWLALWSALGRRVALLAAFAFGYLYFAIPLWGAINGYLQSATVVAVDLLLRLTGVNAYVQGNIVHLAAGTFEIAGGCSGLHFFIVALALAGLYGEVHRDTLATRIKLLALALLLALVTNWVRVYTIILAGYLTDMQHYLVRVEHYRFGWVVFAVMMAIFFVIARKVPATDQEPVQAVAETESLGSRRDLVRGTVLAVAAFSIGPLWNVIAPITAAKLPAASTLLPANPGDWSGPQAASESKWQPTFPGADLQSGGEYHSRGRTLQAFTAVYAWQAQGKELVGHGNSVVEEGTEVVARASSQADSRIAELVVGDARGRQWVLWHTYRIGSMQTRRGVLAEIGYGIASLAGSPVSSVIALRSACEPDCTAARSALYDFVRASGWPTAALADSTQDKQ